jgi:hypothetical protein
MLRLYGLNGDDPCSMSFFFLKRVEEEEEEEEEEGSGTQGTRGALD